MTNPAYQTLAFATQQAWRDWIDANHAASDGIWIQFAKKGSGIASVTYPEAVDTALCYGWIDGQVKSLDQQYWLQKFTPRRARSIWSKVNCAKVEALIASGEMQPAGMREVERAKADGRWDAAYDPPSARTVPDDLQAALDANEAAKAAFDALKNNERYSILFNIQTAKKPETRARRIANVIDRLVRG